MVKPLFDPTFYDYEQQDIVFEKNVKHLEPTQPDIEWYEPTDEELGGCTAWLIAAAFALILAAAFAGWYYSDVWLDRGP